MIYELFGAASPPPPPTLLESVGLDVAFVIWATGWIGFCLSLGITMIKKAQTMAFVQACTNFTYLVHYGLQGASGGAASQVVGVLNGVLKYNAATSPLAKTLHTYLPLALIPLGFINVKKALDLLPLIAVGGRLLSYQASSMLKVRIIQAVALTPWFPYAYALNNFATLLTISLSICLGIVSIFQYHMDELKELLSKPSPKGKKSVKTVSARSTTPTASSRSKSPAPPKSRAKTPKSKSKKA